MCRRAQKARPSLQLLLKLVTSIFCGQTQRQIERQAEERKKGKEKKIKTDKSQMRESQWHTADEFKAAVICQGTG